MSSPQPSTLQLRARLLGLFAVLVAFDVVPLWPVLVAGTPLTLAVQFAFGYRMTLALWAFALVAVPALSLLGLASTACYRLLSRVREYATDAGGAAVCGSPAALADALETPDGATRPERDLRTAETGVRELCVLPYAIDAEADNADTNGDDDAGPDADGTLNPAPPSADGWPGWRLDRLGRYRDRVHERVLPGSHPDVETRVAALRDRQAALERAR